jgi:hypothetical protein
MTLKDRGNKKWTSFWMPEHLTLLKEAERDYRKVQKPSLDEHAIEEIEETISLAMEYNTQLEFTAWRYGSFYKVIGHVHYVDVLGKKFRIVDADGSTVLIPFDEVLKVSAAE